jgi:hypothetical protein
MTKAIVIPADKDQPVRWAEHADNDYRSMTALVFGGDRDGGTYTMSTAGTAERHVSFFYDDNGLFRLDAGEDLADIINLRAMNLWADLDGVRLEDFSVPLVGDYVVVGDTDDEGYSTDAPDWVMDFEFTWHNIYRVSRTGE